MVKIFFFFFYFYFYYFYFFRKSGKIDKSKFNELASIFVKIGYWSMEEYFSIPITDGQTITTSLVYKNNKGEVFTHKISNYEKSGPQNLNDLQTKVIKIFFFFL
jgi:hypothetical protein